MNSYKFNSSAQYHLRTAIANSLGIEYSDVYMQVAEIEHDVITTKDGTKYKITLEKIP